MTELSVRVSIVIPIYNEVESLEPLAKYIDAALTDAPWPWELIFVDDGSVDGSAQRIREIAAQTGTYWRVVELQRNFGQTAALQAGIDLARGNVVVTLDGDLQNNPADIPRMVQRLLDEDLDLVAGWRKSRQDNLWLRTIPSKIANWLIGRVTGVQLHDYGCSLKVYRASVVRGIRLYGDMHRFIPAWLTTNTSAARIKEEVVTHQARQFGKSKYGLSRIYRVLLDLLTVSFFMRFISRPSHFFGRIGLGLGLIGGAILTYLVYVKIFFGEDIGSRPLLIAGVLIVLVAVQLITTGILGEMITRVYFESSGSKPYVIRNAAAQAESDASAGWSDKPGPRNQVG